MKIKVTTCWRCPFGWEQQTRPLTVVCYFGAFELGVKIPFNTVHHDCPLRNGPVMVKLHEYAEVSG